MHELTFSSRLLMEELSNRIENGNFNAESMYKLSREIERNMESFDIQKKKKAAQAEEDLSKIVITA